MSRREDEALAWVEQHLGCQIVPLRQGYEQLTGIALDIDALQYWTIAGPTLWSVFTVPAAQRPDPTMVDTAFMLSYEVQQKRCILEGLAELHGIRLEAPPLPEPDPMQLGPLHATMAGQFEQYWPNRITDPQDAEFEPSYAASSCTNRCNALPESSCAV